MESGICNNSRLMIEIKKFTETDAEFKELARIDNLVNHDSIDHPDDDKNSLLDVIADAKISCHWYIDACLENISVFPEEDTVKMIQSILQNWALVKLDYATIQYVRPITISIRIMPAKVKYFCLLISF